MVPFQAIEEAFETKYPDIDLLIEGHGSIQVIRHLTELHQEADVLVVADYSLIPMLMYNANIPDSDEKYASWYIEFTTNSLGIAYTDDSLYSDEINENNWYEILTRQDVKLGVSDARLDACGYRSFMLLQLAEDYYDNDRIFEDVLGEFKPSVEIERPGTETRIIVPEILRPTDERIVLRGSSIRMLALLDSGDIDYAFEYFSVTEQHNLQFLPLPPEINLSVLDKAKFYEQVVCELDFHRFSSVNPEFIGMPIIYGLTIPANVPHQEEAVRFIEFLLGEEGQAIMADNFQIPMNLYRADNLSALPDSIKRLLAE
jgi:molybdate/tungstate transport system substrate-binding protein